MTNDITPAPSIGELLAMAVERWNAMSPEEQAKMSRKQAESWARAELGIETVQVRVTTPAPEGVAPEQVASFNLRHGSMQASPRGHWVRFKDYAALAADLAAQTARANAAEAETNKVRRFLKISRDEGGEALARAEAAEAKVARLVEAITAEIDARQEYEALPPDRGGSAGPKGRAHAKWLQCRANLIAAIAEVQG